MKSRHSNFSENISMLDRVYEDVYISTTPRNSGGVFDNHFIIRNKPNARKHLKCKIKESKMKKKKLVKLLKLARKENSMITEALDGKDREICAKNRISVNQTEMIRNQRMSIATLHDTINDNNESAGHNKREFDRLALSYERALLLISSLTEGVKINITND